MATSLEDSLFTSAYDRIMARRAREAAAGVQSGAAGSAEATEVSLPSPALEVEPGSEMVGGKVRATALQLTGTLADAHGADWLVSLDGPDAPFGALLGETEYLWLVDWTGRQLREDKPGVIDPSVAPILQSLGLDIQQWAKTVRGYRKLFWQAAGNGESLKSFASRLGKRWLKGQLASRTAFLDAPQLA
jgi:hypothetical protein